MLVRGAVAVAVVVLLPAVPVPSHGATKAPTTRVVTVPYSTPAGHTTGNDAQLWRSPTATGIAQADEDKVTISATDRAGRVALLLKRVRNGVTAERVVCAPLAISVNKGTQVYATPLMGRCPDGKVSTPLGGTVTMVFHKRPKPKVLGAPPSMRWAVLVGINDYAGRTHSTVGGLGDVALIRRALLAAGWRADHILVVKGDQATRENIRWAFDWLARRSTPRTFSLFHFSGHVCIAGRGPCPSGHTYLWAQDNRFIPETEVWSRMSRVRGYSWLDIAGCQAGAFAMHSRYRLFSASSRADETSYESRDWKLSVWSGLVWQRGFMEGQADNGRLPRRATISEMLAYGRTHAPVVTRRAQRGPQHPVVLGGHPSWSLARPPGG